MPGPIAKPAHQRQRRNGTSIERQAERSAMAAEAGRQLGELLVAPAARPETPRWMLAVTKRAWESLWGSPEAKYVTLANMQPLLRLFHFYDELERLAKEFRKEPTTKGYNDQLVLNPVAKRMDQLESKILELEDRFALNPAARLKMGLTFGVALNSLADLNSKYQEEDFDDGDPSLLDEDYRTINGSVVDPRS